MPQALVVALLSLLAGCSGSDPKPHCQFVGNPSSPPELEALITDGKSAMFMPLAEGGPLLLEAPPQGGYVAFVAPKVRNLDGCGVKMTGQLIDPATNQPIAAEMGRNPPPTDLIATDDGWAEPSPMSISNFPNLGACPDLGPTNIVGQSIRLVLTVTDRGGRTVTHSQLVVPTCDSSDPAAQKTCTCSCSANYYMGKCGAT